MAESQGTTHKYVLKDRGKNDSSSSNIALDDPVSYSPDLEPSPNHKKGSNYR